MYSKKYMITSIITYSHEPNTSKINEIVTQYVPVVRVQNLATLAQSMITDKREKRTLGRRERTETALPQINTHTHRVSYLCHLGYLVTTDKPTFNDGGQVLWCPS